MTNKILQGTIIFCIAVFLLTNCAGCDIISKPDNHTSMMPFPFDEETKTLFEDIQDEIDWWLIPEENRPVRKWELYLIPVEEQLWA